MHTSHIWSGDNPKLMVAHVTVVADKGALPQTSHNRMSPSPHVKHRSLHHVRPGVPLSGRTTATVLRTMVSAPLVAVVMVMSQHDSIPKVLINQLRCPKAKDILYVCHGFHCTEFNVHH